MQDKKFYPVYEPLIGEKEAEYASKAVKSGWISSIGEYIEEFERRFADFIGTKYAVSVSNGTVGLHLALAALGIGPGDEVLVPDLTFVATANAVKYTGATPIFVDIDPKTWCMDPEDLKKKITPNSKAVIPVHLYGYPANMDEILNIAQKENLYVIEDCAEAHGAEISNRKVGSFGNCGVFSFYGNKIITTGEGGMITTNDEELFIRLKFLKDHGMSKEKRYWHPEIGFNYRMTNIQAAIGLAQMERKEYIIEKKRKIFNWYKNYLEEFGINVSYSLNPEDDEKTKSKNVFWMVSIVLWDFDETKRNKLIELLKVVGVDSRPFFYPISEFPMYHGKPVCKVSKHVSERGLNLPSSPILEENDVKAICKSFITAVQKI